MKRLVEILVLVLLAMPAAEARRMTMAEVIEAARMQSVAALEARQAFISDYWAWRSYKASRLPSLHFYGDIMNYNRSLVLLQNYEDGTLRYASTNNLQNSLGLRIRQNVTFTGGVLTAYSDLSRIDQFGMDRSLSWYSQPVTLSYTQPLFAYNQFKWDKLIEPKEYEKGRRTYVEAMEQITIEAVKAYSDLILARTDNEIARTNYENTVRMHDVARERLSLGSVTRDEYLQLELRMLNDSISMNETMVAVRDAQMNINSLLGYDESVEIDPELPDELPDLELDYEMVLSRSLENSKFDLENEINILNAQAAVAKAKADRGISMTLNARFGLSNRRLRWKEHTGIRLTRKSLDSHSASLFSTGDLDVEKSRRPRLPRLSSGRRCNSPKTTTAEASTRQSDSSTTRGGNAKCLDVPGKYRRSGTR